MPGDPRIRASDADRDRVASLLREHHAAGRLTAEEFHERMDHALEAKTLGELDGLLADLPAIDLYQLPDASLRRLRHTSGSRCCRPTRAAAAGQVRAGDSGHGRVGGGHVGAHRHLGGGRGGRRRDLVPLVGAHRAPVDLGHSPPLAAPRGIAARPEVSYNLGGSHLGAGSSTLVSGLSVGSCLVGARGFAKRPRYRPKNVLPGLCVSLS